MHILYIYISQEPGSGHHSYPAIPMVGATSLLGPQSPPRSHRCLRGVPGWPKVAPKRPKVPPRDRQDHIGPLYSNNRILEMQIGPGG